MSVKTVVVTGSQGFIGSYICQELLDNGYKVVGIDNFSKYGRVKRPHDDHSNFEFIMSDAIRIDEIMRLRHRKFHCLVACAAMIGGISCPLVLAATSVAAAILGG